MKAQGIIICRVCMQRCSSQDIHSQVPLPDGWNIFRHPNGDDYYYNSGWRLLTPDDVHDPVTLGHITDAREEFLQELQDDPEVYSRLPDDYEVVISDVTASAAVIRMYSRSVGAAYTWTEETGTPVIFPYPSSINYLAGLEVKPRIEFWTFVSEYPSHHPDLPPDTEAEFILALNNGEFVQVFQSANIPTPSQPKLQSPMDIFFPFPKRRLTRFLPDTASS